MSNTEINTTYKERLRDSAKYGREIGNQCVKRYPCTQLDGQSQIQNGVY